MCVAHQTMFATTTATIFHDALHKEVLIRHHRAVMCQFDPLPSLPPALLLQFPFIPLPRTPARALRSLLHLPRITLVQTQAQALSRTISGHQLPLVVLLLEVWFL
jgi:hypothetical protein